MEQVREKMFVVLIGPDCAGKSTIAQQLSDHFNIPTTKCLYIKNRAEMVAGVINTLVFEAPHRTRRGVLLDRWQFPDDIIYEKVYGRENSILLDMMPLLAKLAKEANVLFLHVTASLEELLCRWVHRGDEEVDAAQISMAKNLYEEFINREMSKFSLPVVTINTTDTPSAEVAEKAIRIINNFYGRELK